MSAPFMHKETERGILYAGNNAEKPFADTRDVPESWNTVHVENLLLQSRQFAGLARSLKEEAGAERGAPRLIQAIPNCRRLVVLPCTRVL